MAQVGAYPGAPPLPPPQQPGPPPPPQQQQQPLAGGAYQRQQQQPANARPRQPAPPGPPQQPQQHHRHSSSSQHARPPGRPPGSSSRHAAAGGGQPGGSSKRPPGSGSGGQQQQQAAAARGQAVVAVPPIAADNMADLEQLRRVTPFMCNIRFRNNLPEIPSDPKLIMSTYEPDSLSKFFLTTVEQQPRRELLLPADVGVPISVVDLERYDVPDDLGPRPKLDPADEVLLQDVEGLPSGAGGSQSSIRDVKRSKRGDVSWLMATTYLTSGGDPAPKRGPAAAAAAAGAGGGSGGRFQMGSSQQPQELTKEQQLADIEATFAAVRTPPRHPTKPGVTAVSCVPILPDVEAWPNKYVVVHFPEGDLQNDSRTLAKVSSPKARRELLSHTMLKSYQTQAPTADGAMELTVGLLVPQDLAATAAAGGELPDEQAPEEMVGDYSWECEYNFDLVQNDGGPQQQVLLTMHDDSLGYCHLDGSLKLRKRKRQPGDNRPAKAIVEHRDYYDKELDERRDRVAALVWDPLGGTTHTHAHGAAEGDDDDEDADIIMGDVEEDVDVDAEAAGSGLAAEDEEEDNLFGGGGGGGGGDDEEGEGYQDDAEQGGLGYQ